MLPDAMFASSAACRSNAEPEHDTVWQPISWKIENHLSSSQRTIIHPENKYLSSRFAKSFLNFNYLLDTRKSASRECSTKLRSSSNLPRARSVKLATCETRETALGVPQIETLRTYNACCTVHLFVLSL